MIYIMFDHFGEKVLVEVDNKKVWLSTSNYGNIKAPIDGIKINYQGAIKEFPDLEDREDWRVEAIRRFKKKIEGMESEEQISNYLIEDLRKHKYIPLYKQKKGWRPIAIR